LRDRTSELNNEVFIGGDEVKQHLFNIVNQWLSGDPGNGPPPRIALIGPSGCGKRVLARHAARRARLDVIEIASEWLATPFSSSRPELCRLSATIRRRRAALLLAAFDNDGRNNNQPPDGQLSALMAWAAARPFLGVVVTIASAPLLETSAFKDARFDHRLFVNLPNRIIRREIILKKLRAAADCSCSTLEACVNATEGVTGKELIDLCVAAAPVGADNRRGVIAARFIELANKLEKSVISNDLRSLRAAAGRAGASIPGAVGQATGAVGPGWSEVGGLTEAQTELREAVMLPLLHPGLCALYGIRPARGILLYGPPGCGKTLLARACAAESRAEFIEINGPEVLNPYFGQSEAAIRELFVRARANAPSILYFDEIDAIASKRHGGPTGDLTSRLVAQLLTEMDGFEPLAGVVILASTNRLRAIDPALLRPGRFDRLIRIKLPTLEERAAIFRVTLRRKPVSPEIDLNVLALISKGFSGADIAGACNEAALSALRRRLLQNADEQIAHNDILQGINMIRRQQPRKSQRSRAMH